VSRVLFFGRHDCSYSDDAAKYLKELGFDVKYIKSHHRNEHLPDGIKEWDGEYIFCFRSFFILPIKLIEKASIAAINFHPGPPEYPGSGCLNFALYDNSKEYGVTVHLMDDKVDNGKIIECSRFLISDDDNVDSLLKKTHSELFKLFQRISKGLFLGKDNFLNKKLDSKKNEKWQGSVRKLSELNAFEFVDDEIAKDELTRRIRAFHTDSYPLKIKLYNHIFYLKNK
jgi:methionyl-tRNA formyltransferase|tara:strand:- start:104 stop:784 length:681 start_codon:yes stop_codon:yes gene_type:complete